MVFDMCSVFLIGYLCLVCLRSFFYYFSSVLFMFFHSFLDEEVDGLNQQFAFYDVLILI